MRALRRHAFISYSRSDRAYVDKLVDLLRSAEITPWIDTSGIDYGTRWAQVVRDAVDACGACVVIMTPEAEASPWVGREISRAQKQGRPIFPLLLRGSEFFTLDELHYEDVTDGRMPTDGWLTQLRSRL
jgi:hypothetical protein